MQKTLSLLSIFFTVFSGDAASIESKIQSMPPPISKEVINQEILQHDKRQIPDDTAIKQPNDLEIKSRPVELLYERFNGRPQDIFFLDYKGQKIIGRKLISNLYLNHKIQGTKCSRITASMLLGIFEREQLLSNGLLLFYRPMESGEKLAIFDSLKQQLNTDLYFPYPYLDRQNQESIWPIDFWNLTSEHVDNLDSGEEAFRKYVKTWLSQFDLKGKILYDPSCSTGRFLSEVKKCYPQAFTVGQDINPQMVEYARKHSLIDKVFLGDSINSPIKDNSVDFIFFRFLNLEVVPYEQSILLFTKIANRCRDGGYIVLFGHTPVLLSAEWFQMLGLDVIQCIGYHEDDQSIFQFYVLKKSKPLPTISYQDHSFLK